MRMETIASAYNKRAVGGSPFVSQIFLTKSILVIDEQIEK